MVNPHVAGGKNRTGTDGRTKAGVYGKPTADRGGNKKGKARIMKSREVSGPR